MTRRAQAFCRTLGIRYPIVQSGMSRVAGPELVAAVSNAGGLGILAALRLEPDALRSQIRQIRELTPAPFGVNLWLHPSVVAPIAPDTIDPATRAAARQRLNEIRSRVGLSAADVSPVRFPDLVRANFEVLLDERVPVWSIGLGNPGREMVRECHERGVRVMAMVTNLQDARALADADADFIVAQGTEAGGHRSNWRSATGEAGTMVLVPRLADDVRRPVLAAGGIVDGRGLVAALALGAAGVMLGTRFIATRESIAPDFFKQSVIAAGPGDTVVSSAFTGLPMRTLRNRYSDEYGEAPVLPPMLQSSAAEEIFKRAAERGDAAYFPMPAGESAGLIADLPSAADVITSMASEAGRTIAALTSPE
ncbi:MAG TPA: nitronate monooxygenase [Vicinamibacterales bacterium]|jgi:nitronate monooxygenase|nr:nitronate monooxygenase [Vicinamibacterales bacterium]